MGKMGKKDSKAVMASGIPPASQVVFHRPGGIPPVVVVDLVDKAGLVKGSEVYMDNLFMGTNLLAPLAGTPSKPGARSKTQRLCSLSHFKLHWQERQ